MDYALKGLYSLETLSGNSAYDDMLHVDTCVGDPSNHS